MTNIIDKKEQEKVIGRGLSTLLKTEALPFISRIIIFGSASRYEMTEHSDLDFCIVLLDGVDINAVKKLLWKFKRTSGDRVPYDILVFDEKSFNQKANFGGVCVTINRDGRVLYERERIAS